VGKTFGSSKKKLSNHTAGNGGDFAVPGAASAVMNAVSDGVVLIDNRGIIGAFNPAAARLTGWSVEDAIGLDFRSVFKFFEINEHALPDDRNPIIRAMHSGKLATDSDIFLQTSSKKFIRVSVTASRVDEAARARKTSLFEKLNKPIGAGNSQPTSLTTGHVVVVFSDVTAVVKENHQQSDFISTASHEMRTPVAIIEGYLGMMLNPATATIDSRAEVYAKKAHAAAKHLGHLFQDLLDVTRLEDNRLSSEPILVDAIAATRQVVDQMQAQAKEAGLEMTFENPSGIQPLYIIYVDLDQFQEILDNIIVNAIKYTKRGTIKVKVADNQGKAHISVTDTGIGIPAEDVPHLFQKFYRVDNSDTREIGGTGLGLYLIKTLTEKLGGQVGVDSDYGHGSTFWIEFDILSRDQAIVKAREIKAREARSPNKPEMEDS
jgi:signal transduction histidine kinase